VTEPKLTPEARRDIAESAAWYHQRSVRAAEEFLEAIHTTLARIANNPAAHPVIDPPTGARRALLKRFPHRVLYLLDRDSLVVFAVVHHRRGEGAWRERIS
jgi:toxin ParE1/3/4